jgi:hypothetical protein
MRGAYLPRTFANSIATMIPRMKPMIAPAFMSPRVLGHLVIDLIHGETDEEREPVKRVHPTLLPAVNKTRRPVK